MYEGRTSVYEATQTCEGCISKEQQMGLPCAGGVVEGDGIGVGGGEGGARGAQEPQPGGGAMSARKSSRNIRRRHLYHADF